MTERRTLKPISEVLRSHRFQKEVSLRLFFFAGLSAIYCVFLFARSDSEDVLAMAVGLLVQTIVYAVLSILIRRGSVAALIVTGLLFAANIVFTLFGPSWEDAKGMIVVYGLLAVVLIRFIRRERRAGSPEGEP